MAIGAAVLTFRCYLCLTSKGLTRAALTISDRRKSRRRGPQLCCCCCRCQPRLPGYASWDKEPWKTPRKANSPIVFQMMMMMTMTMTTTMMMMMTVTIMLLLFTMMLMTMITIVIMLLLMMTMVTITMIMVLLLLLLLMMTILLLMVMKMKMLMMLMTIMLLLMMMLLILMILLLMTMIMIIEILTIVMMLLASMMTMLMMSRPTMSEQRSPYRALVHDGPDGALVTLVDQEHFRRVTRLAQHSVGASAERKNKGQFSRTNGHCWSSVCALMVKVDSENLFLLWTQLISPLYWEMARFSEPMWPEVSGLLLPDKIIQAGNGRTARTWIAGSSSYV